MNAIWLRLSEFFSWESISTYLVDKLIPDLIVGLLVFLFFYIVYRVLAKLVIVAFRKSVVDATAKDFIQTILKALILTIGLVSSLSQVGINTGAMLTSLGVAGLTLGFAAKDTLSNVISGIFIFWDRPFVVDDLVEIDGKYGRVETITMRTTRVVTVDGKMLAIPNSIVVNSTVASYTNFPHLRLDVAVSIGVEEDIDNTRTLLLDKISADERFSKTPKPTIVVKAINDYNLELEVRAWIDDERRHIAARFALRELIFETLRRASVVMPYETLQLAPVTVTSAAS